MTAKRKATFLTVRNFGPIVRADVELRPLTVLVGPSNTGKSFLSILLYALHQAHRRRSDLRKALPFRKEIPSRVTKRDRQAIDAWARRRVSDSRTGFVEMSEPVANFVATMGRSEYTGQVAGELAHCFGVKGLRQLVRRSADASTFGLGSAPDAPDLFSFRVSRSGRYSIDPATLDGAIDRARLPRMSVNERWLDPREIEETISSLVELGLIMVSAGVTSTVSDLAQSAHYLPADRTGIMHAHRVVVSSLIRSASQGGFRAEAPLPELSGVVADFLERIVAMRQDAPPTHTANPISAKHAKDDRRISDLSARLQRDVLDGSVSVAQSEPGYPSFSYQPTGWNDSLPLANASSMVSELAPVVLFLRQVVAPGDTLIVEEPEAHLHPAKQVEFTHHLAAVAKAGVRVVITTHSEWVLEALANLVRMSALPKAARRGLPGGEFALEPKEVGAWMFQPHKRPKGSVVTEVPLDLESATFPAGFGEVTASLYNDWVRISNRVEQGRQ